MSSNRGCAVVGSHPSSDQEKCTRVPTDAMCVGESHCVRRVFKNYVRGKKRVCICVHTVGVHGVECPDAAMVSDYSARCPYLSSDESSPLALWKTISASTSVVLTGFLIMVGHGIGVHEPGLCS